MRNYLYKKIDEKISVLKFRLAKGFTLVETLVAVSVLTISILGTFTAVQSGLSQSIYAKDQITAFFLIQEAMESIRNIRDNNAIYNVANALTLPDPIDWRTGITTGTGCDFGETCYVDATNNSIVQCSGTCPYLKQNTTTGLYSYDSAQPDSRFRREVVFTSIDNNEMVIAVSVIWSSKGKTNTITINQSLLNSN